MKNIFLSGFIFLMNVFSLNAQNRTENFEKEFARADKIFYKVYNEGKDVMPAKKLIPERA